MWVPLHSLHELVEYLAPIGDATVADVPNDLRLQDARHVWIVVRMGERLGHDLVAQCQRHAERQHKRTGRNDPPRVLVQAVLKSLVCVRHLTIPE